MTRKLLIALVLMAGIFIGTERYLHSVAAVEVDFLIVECGETWFKAALDMQAKEVRVMISRAEDGVVLNSKVFPASQNQDAQVIYYPRQPDGTVLTISFGEWEAAYLEEPIVTDVPCDADQHANTNIIPTFATVTRGPTLIPSATHTASVTPDMTATNYWLVITYGPGILTYQAEWSQTPAASKTYTPTPGPSRTPSQTPQPR